MKNYYPLSFAPLDDDYLYEMNHSTSYQHEDDYEDEVVSDEYDPEHPYWLEDDYDPRTDPLRLVHMADRERKIAV